MTGGVAAIQPESSPNASAGGYMDMMLSNTVEDFLWLHLCALTSAPTTAIHDAGLRELAESVKTGGPSHFEMEGGGGDAGNSDNAISGVNSKLLFTRVLFCVGELEHGCRWGLEGEAR